ncbi:hypothetical protein [Duganella qianjiadongensis]|uniref:Uncharacterized protein n=1 Tax=Duganella qianjiadongensis TaxID=2692176 RepID=A0ABW9VJS8_9BURK|nr:hypothetical protein [Duganella qianjiadongensis]MYM39582.1 hypothetical protein [Duganella qianjiadongensis]
MELLSDVDVAIVLNLARRNRRCVILFGQLRDFAIAAPVWGSHNARVELARGVHQSVARSPGAAERL